MAEKFSDARPEMSLAEEHHSVQTFGLDGLDKPFGTRVQIRTPRRQDQRRDATASQQAPKRGRVQWVSVQDDVLSAAEEPVRLELGILAPHQGFGNVARCATSGRLTIDTIGALRSCTRPVGRRARGQMSHRSRFGGLW
jgi:hypothetical protein